MLVRSWMRASRNLWPSRCTATRWSPVGFCAHSQQKKTLGGHVNTERCLILLPPKKASPKPVAKPAKKAASSDFASVKSDPKKSRSQSTGPLTKSNAPRASPSQSSKYVFLPAKLTCNVDPSVIMMTMEHTRGHAPAVPFQFLPGNSGSGVHRQKACHEYPSTFQNFARSKFAVLTPRSAEPAFWQCQLCDMGLTQSNANAPSNVARWNLTCNHTALLSMERSPVSKSSTSAIRSRT